jgi:hypothetical protein
MLSISDGARWFLKARHFGSVPEAFAAVFGTPADIRRTASLYESPDAAERDARGWNGFAPRRTKPFPAKAPISHEACRPRTR